MNFRLRKYLVAVGITFHFLLISGSGAYAQDWPWGEYGQYDSAYLQVEHCFARPAYDREACVADGVSICISTIEAVLQKADLYIPGGALVSPSEFCNYTGMERADVHLNEVYQRLLADGPAISYSGLPESFRAFQRAWIAFAEAMCSEESIIGWHAGGSGWHALIDSCRMRLSLQQAANLERFFTVAR